jgi:large subunit ribosomal protein L24
MNRIRKGDNVIVITGKDKGRRGTVLRVLANGKIGRAHV